MKKSTVKGRAHRAKHSKTIPLQDAIERARAGDAAGTEEDRDARALESFNLGALNRVAKLLLRFDAIATKEGHAAAVRDFSKTTKDTRTRGKLRSDLHNVVQIAVGLEMMKEPPPPPVRAAQYFALLWRQEFEAFAETGEVPPIKRVDIVRSIKERTRCDDRTAQRAISDAGLSAIFGWKKGRPPTTGNKGA